MRLAYLTVRYPHPRRGIARDEVRAIEAQGVRVERFSILPADQRTGGGAAAANHGDDADGVRVLRGRNVPSVVRVALLTLWSRPALFLAAARVALRLLSRRGDRSSGGGGGNGGGGGGAERRVCDNLMRLAEACMLLRETQRLRVEHVHARGGGDAASVALLCHALGGPPFSFVAHGPDEFDRPHAVGLEEKIRQASFVVTDDAYGRAQVLRWSGHAQWSNVHVVRPAVQPAGPEVIAFAAEHFAAHAHVPRFVCVGRLCESKGQRILVEAAALLAAERLAFEIVIVGDGPLRNQLEALVRLRGLSGRFRFVGAPRSDDDVRERMTGVRAVVIPSLSEGRPTPALHAYAVGRPVIATSVAGIPELVEDGRSGWLVEPGNVEAMAAAMRDAMQCDCERVESLGAAGRTRLMERHAPAAAAARLQPLFRGSVAAARGRRGVRKPSSRQVASERPPRVSVVIVNWNRADDVAFNLRHLRKVDYPNVEVIVVDNGSSDASVERLTREPGVTLIRLGSNVGPSRARNVGIHAATGKYVVFLDSDAVLSRHALRALVERMESDPSIGIAGCKILNWHTRQIDQWIYAEPYETHGNRCFDSYSFSAAGAIARAEALRDVGGFWERLFIYNEEVDLSIRMLRGGYRIVYAADARVFHRPASEGRAGSSNYLRLQIRNWIWIYFRYYPRLVCWWKVASYSAIYLLKGVANRELLAATRGILEGLRHMSIIREYADDKLSYEEVGLIDSLNRRTAIRLRR